MSHLKPREKIIGILTAIVVVIWAWTFLILRPIGNFEEDLDAEIKEKSLKLYEAKKVLSGASQDFAGPDLRKQFSTEGSAQEDMSQLIKEIETAATGAGLRVSETKPQPLIKNVGWFELKVIISFEGKMSDITRFFYMLENGPKPLLVNEMSLEASTPQQAAIRGRLEIGRLLIMKSID